MNEEGTCLEIERSTDYADRLTQTDRQTERQTQIERENISVSMCRRKTGGSGALSHSTVQSDYQCNCHSRRHDVDTTSS